MADTWEVELSFRAGENARQFDIGPPSMVGSDKLGSDVTGVLGYVRIAAPVLMRAEQSSDWEAVVSGADGGFLIGPVDLPALVSVPLPARVTVRRRLDIGGDEGSARVLVQAVLGAPPAGFGGWSATRTVRLGAGEWTDVPTGARQLLLGCAVVGNLTLQWELADGSVIGANTSSTQPNVWPIPGAARRVRSTVAQPVFVVFGLGL